MQMEEQFGNGAYITSIKEGNERLLEVMNYIDQQITLVQDKLDAGDLAEKSDEKFVDALILSWLSDEP